MPRTKAIDQATRLRSMSSRRAGCNHEVIREECCGLQSPQVDSYYETSTDPRYLLLHWDRFRGAWRSKSCPLYLDETGESGTCHKCLEERAQLRDRHPVLFPNESPRQGTSKPSAVIGRVRKLFVLSLATLAGFLHYKHVSILNENHVNFSHLSTLERELYFRTEMGFYYSFFKQGIEAPTMRDGIHALLADNITEYPTTINALNRFNLYPEVILSAAYRGYMRVMESQGRPTKRCFRVNRGNAAPAVSSCEGLGEPPYFYIEGVFLLAGFMMGGFFLLAYFASGGEIMAGVVAVAAFFFNHSECTRVMWAPPLRESFSYPFFVWQQLALLYAIKMPRSPLHLMLFILATLLFMLPWQFAQFVLVLQACALYGCYLFGALDATALRLLLISMMAAGALSSALQWGNAMLISGLFPSSIISMLALSYTWLNRLHFIRRIPIGGILLLITTLGVKYTLAILSDTTDDSHIFDLLLAKFNPRYSTFDTKLYLCSPEFDFYTMSSVVKLTETLVLPTAVVSVVIFVLRSILFKKRGSIALRAPEQSFLFLQLIAFALLAGLISRLKVLFTPQLILTASLLLNKLICPVPTKYRQALALALLAGMAFQGIPNLQEERGIVGEYSNYQLEEVVHWILRETNLSDSFVGPMTIMATVRETTFRKIYNHPHYEDAGLRNRTRHAYSMYSRKPLEEIWRIHKEQIGTRYIISERMLCLSMMKEGCRYRDKWDVEDPTNAGNVPVCEDLFSTHDGLEPYFHKVFENHEFTILQVVNPSESESSAAVCKERLPGPSNRKYLLYKVQSGEGFNVQRNVFMRVVNIAMRFLAAHDITIVLPPFANSIHWSDKSTHPFGTFFDLDVLGESLSVTELSNFLSKSRWVDTLVHLSMNKNHSNSEVITRDDSCTPDSITFENSGWHNEVHVKRLNGFESVAPYEGAMLGHTFLVRNIICLKVRFDMHGSHLASTLSEVFTNSTSVLVDNAGRISWDYASGEGEESSRYYEILGAMRFKKHIYDAALDFMSSHIFGRDYIAIHLRRNDFLKVRPNVPTPANVGVQIAAIMCNISESLLSSVQRTSLYVYVATDSTERMRDIAELQLSLTNSLKKQKDESTEVEVITFPDSGHGLEAGEVALVDQVICANADHFLGSNTSYFTKTIVEERILLGKSVLSSFGVLCDDTSNSNGRCQEDLRQCITCMDSWIPRLTNQTMSVLASMKYQHKLGFDRHQSFPPTRNRAEPNDGESTDVERDVNRRSIGICFVIMSQSGSGEEERMGEELSLRIQTKGHATFLLHNDVSQEEQSWGYWTYLPLLSSFSSGKYNCDDTPSWYVFLKPSARPDIDAIVETLSSSDSSQRQFLGRALRDTTPSICHHYDRKFDFSYPSLDFGFALSTAVLRRQNQKQWSEARRFHIDPAYELAKHLLDTDNVALTNVTLSVERNDDKRNLPSWEGHPVPQAILVCVKTTKSNHLTRIPILKKVWTDAAARSGARIIFYSETKDDEIPTVHDGIENSEKINGDAKKLRTILDHAYGLEPFEWLLITDDDTLLNIIELRRVLSKYDALEPVIIGDRYAYGHGTPGGYDYITGGGGIAVSRRAVEMITLTRSGVCVVKETGAVPDDMWLGRCAQSLAIPLVDEAGFHQARPSDYHLETISRRSHVSFHRFRDTNEALEISHMYLDYNYGSFR